MAKKSMILKQQEPMPRLSAATTAFWAAMTASVTASSRSPLPGCRGRQPAASKPSYHFRQSAQKISTILPVAIKGWWSQVSASLSFSAWSVMSRMVYIC